MSAAPLAAAARQRLSPPASSSPLGLPACIPFAPVEAMKLACRYRSPSHYAADNAIDTLRHRLITNIGFSHAFHFHHRSFACHIAAF